MNLFRTVVGEGRNPETTERGVHILVFQKRLHEELMILSASARNSSMTWLFLCCALLYISFAHSLLSFIFNFNAK